MNAVPVDAGRVNGRIFRDADELFAEVGWMQVMHGQRLAPCAYHALVDVSPEDKVVECMANIRGVIAKCTGAMPSHEAFIAKHCAAKAP